MSDDLHKLGKQRYPDAPQVACRCGKLVNRHEVHKSMSYGYLCQDCYENVTKPPSVNDQAVLALNVLQEATNLIYGDRQDAYGSVNESFSRIARLWTEMLQVPVTADQVALCLIQLKVARAMNDTNQARPIKRDTIVDIAGYAGCLGKLLDGQ